MSKVAVVVTAIKCPYENCRAEGINCLNCLREIMASEVNDITRELGYSDYSVECIEELRPDLVDANVEVLEGERNWIMSFFVEDATLYNTLDGPDENDILF